MWNRCGGLDGGLDGGLGALQLATCNLQLKGKERQRQRRRGEVRFFSFTSFTELFSLP